MFKTRRSGDVSPASLLLPASSASPPPPLGRTTLYPIRTSKRATRLALALWSCAFVAGCGGEKPVGDAQKYHPNGIGMDMETANVSAKPKR